MEIWYTYTARTLLFNGAIGEMHARRVSNIYDMAMKMGAPVIGLVDCAGFRLQEATDALEAFGKLYQKQVNGFRSDPSDHSNLRNMWRWTFYRTCSDRFHIHGDKEW